MNINNGRRVVLEQGKVVSKIYEEAKNERVFNGVTYPAKEECYKLLVISSYEFSEEKGFSNPVVIDYVVDKKIYDKSRFGSDCLVRYEMSNYKGQQRYSAVDFKLV